MLTSLVLHKINICKSISFYLQMVVVGIRAIEWIAIEMRIKLIESMTASFHAPQIIPLPEIESPRIVLQIIKLNLNCESMVPTSTLVVNLTECNRNLNLQKKEIFKQFWSKHKVRTQDNK